MLCREGCISVYCFVFGFALSFSALLLHILLGWSITFLYFGPLLYFIVVNIVLRFVYEHKEYQIAVRAAFLSFVLSIGVLLFMLGPDSWKSFGAYGVFMATFHYSEFLAIAWTNPETLTVDSFILNHSLQYALAAMASWFEFFLELYYWPWMKEHYLLIISGIILCIAGEFLRKLAIITAHSNFNHIVQFTKSESHQLVKHGVYSFMRHPSYVGWFWWSIGTQIILGNPICTILYTFVSWRFFKDRIFVEEITLLNFFGEEYYSYQQNVRTGLPFINGYDMETNQFK